jgi:hypothetical protein
MFKVRNLAKKTVHQNSPIHTEDEYEIDYIVDNETGEIREEKVLKTTSSTVSVTPIQIEPKKQAYNKMSKVSVESFM